MTRIDVSVALSASFDAAEHIAAAEEMGYRRANLFDTPFEGGDVWLSLHRVAQLTATIELGPGVLVPTLRHPIVNAAQTVSLYRLAPGRVVAGFGTGFSSRAALGQPPIRWSYIEAYIRAYCDSAGRTDSRVGGRTNQVDAHVGTGRRAPATDPIAGRRNRSERTSCRARGRPSAA